MVAYAPTADLLDRLGISVGDSREGLLSDVLEAASRWVDKETARVFSATASQTRYYTSRSTAAASFWNLERPWGGAQSVLTDDLLTVTLLATDEDGDGVYETTWTVGTDYWLGPRNAPQKSEPYRTINRNRSVGRYVFPIWENGVAVTGTFGYSTVPPSPIRMVTLEAAEIAARPLLDIAVPGAQTYKLGAELTVSMNSANLSEFSQRTLLNYRDLVFA